MRLNNGFEIPQIGVGTWTLRGETARQIVLRWIIQRDLITIPRAKPNHFKENLDIMAFSLSNEDMQAISALNQNLRSNALNDPETFPW
jgi:D-xylose reductase